MKQPTAEQALRQIDPLVGEWTLEARSTTGEPWPGGGKVVFEWHDSGAHLVQRGTGEHPDAPDNISIIGCDAANGTYFQLYSDERGVCRVYQMTISFRPRSGSLFRTAPVCHGFLARFDGERLLYRRGAARPP